MFLPHADRLHFSLHIPTFIQDATRPPDDLLRPHECLTSTIALWALCIMGPEAEYDVLESHYLKTSLDALPSAHSSAEGRYRIHAIQTELLLALYFLNDSRVVEGRYHLAAATSGILACNLNRIPASQDLPTTVAPAGLLASLSIDILPHLALGSPQTSLELGERINLFWNAYALDRCWSVPLGLPSAQVDQYSGSTIKLPGPRPLDVYQNVSRAIYMTCFAKSNSCPQLTIDEILSSAELSIYTVFEGSVDLNHLLAQPSSSYVAFVIASALFENATRVACSRNLNGKEPWKISCPSLDRNSCPIG